MKQRPVLRIPYCAQLMNNETTSRTAHNLNFDPLRYVQLMNKVAPHSPLIGMGLLLTQVRQAFALLRFGYFNPPREAF